jgi:ABC-type bacteriocin/lantibiotic exporter with double-glycine peptidase domain
MSCDPSLSSVAGDSDHHGSDGSHGSHHASLPPLTRLLKLLRPEHGDIWVVIIFSAIVGVLTLASPVAVEALVNTVAFGQYLQPVVVLALVLLVFLLFAAAMRGLITFVVEVFQRRLFIRVVEDLAYRLPRSRHSQFDMEHGPELVNRFFDVVTLQKASAGLLLEGTAIVLQTAIGMVVLAIYHPFLLGFDAVLLALMLFAILVLGRGAVNTAINESRAKYAIAAWLEELVRHPTAFKMHAGAQFALDRADQLAVNWLDARRNHFRILLRQILFALGVQALASTALLGLGGWLVIQGELTLGQLVAAELIVVVIVGSFAKLGKHMESFYDLMASMDKLGHLFDLTTEPHDKSFHLREGTPAALSVCNVSLHVDHESVLHDLNFQVEPGSSVAVTGAPGSGKTMLVDLLCGLRAPTGGHIELDGIDLRELRPDSLREHLAVAREVEVFHGTIDENVHMNRPHISAADVREAMDAVGLLDEVLQLPEGLNTLLRTGGAPLTSSQARRLMLARAIVGRPRMLLIDGTLDAIPDKLLPSLLSHLQGPQTPWSLLVTTGRESIRKACDQVIDLSHAGSASGRSAGGH